MPRRLLVTSLLTLVVSTLTVLAPAGTQATTTRTIPMRHDASTFAVTKVHVVTLDRPADNVVAYWRGNPHAAVTLALSQDGSTFGAQQDAGRDEIGGERQDGTTYGALHAADGAVAVRVTTDRPIAKLTVLGLSDGATTTRTSGGSSLAPAADAATTEPTVIPRGTWGADPAYMTWAPQFYPTKKLIVHHTDTSDDYADQAGAEEQIRSIYYYHSVTQGWGDIGYNFLIDKFGNVYEGRYSREYAGANPTGDDASGNGVTGAHTGGWNSGTVGVALLGTLTTHDATPAAREALERLLAWEASRNGIDPQATTPFVNPVSGATITTPNIAGHRDYAATACPGDTFYATLPTIRAETAALVTGTPAPTPDTTAPTAPTGLKATAGRTSVSLSWNAATDDVGVARYQVFRRAASGAYTQVGSTTGRTFTVGSLARRTSYSFKVRAVDAAGNIGLLSAAVSARTT
jgi:hypothetical protein